MLPVKDRKKAEARQQPHQGTPYYACMQSAHGQHMHGASRRERPPRLCIQSATFAQSECGQHGQIAAADAAIGKMALQSRLPALRHRPRMPQRGMLHPQPPAGCHIGGACYTLPPEPRVIIELARIAAVSPARTDAGNHNITLLQLFAQGVAGKTKLQAESCKRGAGTIGQGQHTPLCLQRMRMLLRHRKQQYTRRKRGRREHFLRVRPAEGIPYKYCCHQRQQQYQKRPFEQNFHPAMPLSFNIACSGSEEWNTELPATSASAPASKSNGAFCAFTPPSTSIRVVRPCRSIC